MANWMDNAYRKLLGVELRERQLLKIIAAVNIWNPQLSKQPYKTVDATTLNTLGRGTYTH
eukprot:CAMPEP_0196822960 /NCGR_PEP_ID=MMETSP1362-20130617/85496_1 /TAXON_ID=163516 /ORGANISM="Leptocylindrus danicus, Strain CCMP1856" /LENGTH=59 /DNA_ID=CAMNT_0042202667 /DNA_START=118 /DNA_END=297 /DNA_ORIENTATION=+